jgi:hypothetical protein
MLNANLFIKSLFKGKIRIITYLTILTFVIGIVFSFSETTLTTYAKYLYDFGIACLTTILVTAFEAIKGGDAPLLINLFAIQPDKKIAIVIPSFAEGVVIPNESKPDTRISLAEIPSLSRTDSFAAFQLQALLINHNFDSPEILTDEEAVRIYEDDKALEQYGTFISIGLSSNKFSSRVAATPVIANMIKLDINQDTTSSQKSIQIKGNDGQMHSHRPDNNKLSDIACFIKAKVNHSTKPTFRIIICGGLNATGTSKLAVYVSRNWKKLRKITIKEIPIKKLDNCALLFKIYGKQDVRLDPDATLEDHPYVVL